MLIPITAYDPGTVIEFTDNKPFRPWKWPATVILNDQGVKCLKFPNGRTFPAADFDKAAGLCGRETSVRQLPC